MSDRAIIKLRELWKELEFFVVERTVAREPEDVLSIGLWEPTSHLWPNGEPMHLRLAPITDETQRWTRLRDVPEHDRDRVHVIWRRFHGVTTDGRSFDSRHYHELNFNGSIDPPLGFGTDYGATHITDRPEPGQLICGTVEQTPVGTRLSRWFVTGEAFKLLVTMTRENRGLSEEELGRQLLIDGFPDTYWAIARLVFFDDVQAFVDCIKIRRPGNPSRLGRHPAFGEPYGRYGLTVDWDGMCVGIGIARLVHQLSHILEPGWWEEFRRLSSEQGVSHTHPGPHGICHACIDEAPTPERRLDFPYRFGGRET